MTDTEKDFDKPVAYDKDGRPLYARPADTKSGATSPVVHVARPVDPAKPVVSEETKRRHEEAVKKYPYLNLSEGEYVISAIRRHWVGLVAPLFIGFFLVATVFAVLMAYPVLVPANNPAYESIILPAFLLLILVGIGTYIVVWVYLQNRFFLTNESVIQEIQTSLFSHHEQTVSLMNIEDASYTQTGLLPLLFNYGSIRLSTEGDETTYRFYYVSNPKKQIATLNNAVEAFKNGRPVAED